MYQTCQTCIKHVTNYCSYNGKFSWLFLWGSWVGMWFFYTGGYWFKSPSHDFIYFFKSCVHSFHVCIMHMVSELKMRVPLTLIPPLRFRVGGPRRPHGDRGDWALGSRCVHRGRGQETGAAEAQSQTKGILPSVFWIQTHTHTHCRDQLANTTISDHFLQRLRECFILILYSGEVLFFGGFIFYFRTSELQDVEFCIFLLGKCAHICVAFCVGFLWLYLSCTLTVWYFEV